MSHNSAQAKDNASGSPIIIINELLCFVLKKMDLMPQDDLIKICSGFYTAKQIKEAKQILYDSCNDGTIDKLKFSRGAKMKTRDMKDILKIIHTTRNTIPRFVAENIDMLPPISFDRIDVSSLLASLNRMEGKMQLLAGDMTQQKYAICELTEKYNRDTDKNLQNERKMKVIVESEKQNVANDLVAHSLEDSKTPGILTPAVSYKMQPSMSQVTIFTGQQAVCPKVSSSQDASSGQHAVWAVHPKTSNPEISGSSESDNVNFAVRKSANLYNIEYHNAASKHQEVIDKSEGSDDDLAESNLDTSHQVKENHHLIEGNKELCLNPYDIPSWFQTLAYNNQPVEIWKRMQISPVVTFENYKNFFRTLLWLEEIQEKLDIQFYRKKEVTLHFLRNDFSTGLKLVEFIDPDLAACRPVMKRDKVFVCLSEEAKITDNPQWYEGIVHQVNNTSICLGFHKHKFISNFDSKTKLNLEFTINRYNFQVCHRAVDLCTKDYFQDILFPTESRKSAKKTPERIEHLPDLIFYDLNIGNNYEQMQAIQHIVCGVRRSSPYIIFGPPGTGKTVTIVEAIKQILYIIPESYVMVCAPSNSAADAIEERLLDHFTGEHVFRMYSESRIKFLKELPEKLLKASNYLKELDSVYFPSKEALMSKRVIVCTFIAAAKIAAAQFPEGHFTHVILDDAGRATECEALIGVGGILSPKGKLILAGDLHKLGPMVQNLQAVSKGHIFEETGLDTSLLERIMNIPMYSNQNNVYDPEYVTKLVKNYRSHHTILKVPNELFYKSELQAKGSDLLVNEYVNWRHLPKRGFPIIVHSVISEERTAAHFPSDYNPEEVMEVISYLRKLLKEEAKPEDIGIITPYRLQMEKLRNELKWIDVKVKVGSVEDFQGQERKIIIISTVRASKRYLAMDYLFKSGFLRNPKRFNVAITRAQCLLILVCCSDVLLLDRNWKRFIDYAQANGGYIGKSYRVPKEGLDERCKRMGELDIRPIDKDISKKQIVEIPSW